MKVALRAAKTRPLGEAWGWTRKKSTGDITPLVAVTLALWGAMREQESVYETRPAILLSLDEEREEREPTIVVDGEIIAAW